LSITIDAGAIQSLTVRNDNPSWGGRMIHDYPVNQGKDNLPSSRTCCNILSRNGCILQEESLKHQAFKRFSRKHCNDLWQTDFKGATYQTASW